MKVLLIGASGMLGSDLERLLMDQGHEVIAPSLDELDISNPTSVSQIAVQQWGAGIHWCINCAAYTAVDFAENQRDLAAALNTLAPGYIARSCLIAGIRLLHISTDFVFDGSKSAPYTEEDPIRPMSIYGKTKADGEISAMQSKGSSVIFRTSWLYGAHGKSFPKTMLQLHLAGKSLNVVSDQIGCPTSTVDLSRSIVKAIECELAPGIYHATGYEAMSWYDFAKLTLETWHELNPTDTTPIQLNPIPTSEYPTPAVRPKYSVLDNTKLHESGIPPMRPVRESLVEFLTRLDV